jgi:arylsulfatase A-like enzyme
MRRPRATEYRCPCRPLFVVLALCGLFALRCRAADAPRPPNVVLILCDDLGYGDLGCYGNKNIRTPNIDRLAEQGVRFTDFYAAGAQCTPSRAGLLTGRYPVRFELTYTLMTNAGAGVPKTEMLLPQVLQTAGYTTMLVGKWHLGDRPEFHPRRHGFDHFTGLLRGHDTEPREFWKDDNVVDREADPATLTQRYTDTAVDFIAERGKDAKPFFLMVSHTSPHTPLAPAAAFKGKSAAGAYGDVVEEIDASVARIIEALKRAGVDQNTLIVFSSDNGPAIDKGPEGGSTGPLRAGKFSTFEGGVRVPAIASWPGRIKPRVERQPGILLDWFATIASITGAKPPADRTIDGRELSRVLFEGGKRDGDEFFFYFRDELQACRIGNWKLKREQNRPMLFDLETDQGETRDMSNQRGDVVRRIENRMREFDGALKGH